MAYYNNMVTENKKKSETMVKKTLDTIQAMQESNERVTVSALMKKLEYSRQFYYRNPAVRAAIEKAKEQQKGIDFSAIKRNICEAVNIREISNLKKVIENKNKAYNKLLKEHEDVLNENETLKKELEKAKKQINELKEITIERENKKLFEL